MTLPKIAQSGWCDDSAAAEQETKYAICEGVASKQNHGWIEVEIEKLVEKSTLML